MNSKASKTCLCIAGWHFPAETFQMLKEILNTDVFVVSHQPRSKIPEHVFATVGANRVLITPNLGHDWGCYQQFIASGNWKDYETVAFMHDDVTILDPSLLAAGREKFDQHAVVANGVIESPRAWTDTHPESYIHASWLPPAHYIHDVVRGSFFMMSRQILERIGFLDVFWDRYIISSFFGNWSTRASCARWQHMFGQKCFGFLSETGCISQYLIEQVRGVDARTHDEMRVATANYLADHSIWRRWLWQQAVHWSRMYMQQVWTNRADGIERPSPGPGAWLVLHMAKRPNWRSQ